MSFIELRSQIETLDAKLEPFEKLVEQRMVKHDESHIVNNAMSTWSRHEEFLDFNEMGEFRSLSHKRFLLTQELDAIYQADLIENRKERIQLSRALRKAGVKGIDKRMMTSEMRQLAEVVK